MNKSFKSAIIGTIQRGRVHCISNGEGFSKYSIEINPASFVHIARKRHSLAKGYIYSLNTASSTYSLNTASKPLTEDIFVPDNAHAMYVLSADQVDVQKIWNAVVDRDQAQQREKAMSSDQKKVYDEMMKFISEYDATKALEQQAISRKRINVK